MGLSVQTWQEKLKSRLQGWKQRMLANGIDSIYATIATSALWPVVEAARSGEWGPLAALGAVVGSVGTNLLANRIQAWKDEAEAAHDLSTEVVENADLRLEVDTLLDQLEALPWRGRRCRNKTGRGLLRDYTPNWRSWEICRNSKP